MPKLINRLIPNRVLKPKIWTLQNFQDRYNHILIRRDTGGFGDIMMLRMIFEDFKLICPEIHITFACPQMYHCALKDHPFIDDLVDSHTVEKGNFGAEFDVSTICGFVESFTPDCQKHRSDIWAEDGCGIKLTRHDMHIKLTDEEINEAKAQISVFNKEGKKTVAFAPMSALSNKNMSESQRNGVLKAVESDGFFVYGLHHVALANYEGVQLSGKNMRNFICLVNAADYVITVDTAAFHIAGGLKKPQVAVFAWKSGTVYGKYYSNCEIVQKNLDNRMSDISVEDIMDGFKRSVEKCQE